MRKGAGHRAPACKTAAHRSARAIAEAMLLLLLSPSWAHFLSGSFITAKHHPVITMILRTPSAACCQLFVTLSDLPQPGVIAVLYLIAIIAHRLQRPQPASTRLGHSTAAPRPSSQKKRRGSESACARYAASSDT